MVLILYRYWGCRSRHRGRSRRHIFQHVTAERLFEPSSKRPWHAAEEVAVDFGHADEIAIGGGDEYLIGGVKIIELQRRFFATYFLREADDIEENAARDAFQAA